MDEWFKARRDSYSKSLTLGQILVCDKLAEVVAEKRNASSVYPDLFDEFSKEFTVNYDDAKFTEMIKTVVDDEKRNSDDLLFIYDHLCRGK